MAPYHQDPVTTSILVQLQAMAILGREHWRWDLLHHAWAQQMKASSVSIT